MLVYAHTHTFVVLWQRTKWFFPYVPRNIQWIWSGMANCRYIIANDSFAFMKSDTCIHMHVYCECGLSSIPMMCSIFVFQLNFWMLTPLAVIFQNCLRSSHSNEFPISCFRLRWIWLQLLSHIPAFGEDMHGIKEFRFIYRISIFPHFSLSQPDFRWIYRTMAKLGDIKLILGINLMNSPFDYTTDTKA